MSTEKPHRPTPQALAQRLKTRATALGFQLAGVCEATRPPGGERLDAWLRAGYGGEMTYLADRRDAYHDPSLVLPGVKSILMLGMAYHTAEPTEPLAGQGRVSRYAWGEADYHDLIRQRLHALADELRRLVPDAKTRCTVDTAPLLERDFARLAGLGWVGKNTLLINKPQGSYFFLAAILTDVELAVDEPYQADHCGTCTACLDACPTDAFPQPYVLDATRCISYLTIESRQASPQELRKGVGDWLFGCDVCQDVCPWNRKATGSNESAFAPVEGMDPVDLQPLFAMTDGDFRKRFRHTPLWRAHRDGLLRNAAVVLGNRPAPAAVPALIRGLEDPAAMVRGACAWALGKHRDASATQALRARRQIESDDRVLSEIDAALAGSIRG